jgi:SHS2 domain-containing protein
MISGYTFAACYMKNYKYIDHTADIGIEVHAKTIEELFINIGIAIFETQVSGHFLSQKELNIKIVSESLEELFIDWCRELLYHFSVHSFIPQKYDISIEKFSLSACLSGDKFDAKRHKIKTEIKNATYHNLKVNKVNDLYKAMIIFDV